MSNADVDVPNPDYEAWLADRRSKNNAQPLDTAADAVAAAGAAAIELVEACVAASPLATNGRRAGDGEDLGLVGHPLYEPLTDAIEQAMHGKGERHGGSVTPFLDQPWTVLAKAHGRGFLTGQAAKKLDEAVRGKAGEAFERELLGAIVYLGMALLYERGLTK